jgi:acyl-CoA reductase-like NAD-dependent aldehyde dehydrogenase
MKTELLEVRTPYDNTLISTVKIADETVIEQALKIASELFNNRKKWLTPAKRIEILEKTITLMQSQADTLAFEAAREGGKPLIDSKIEVARAIDGVKICIETLRTNAGKEIPMNLNSASTNRLAFTHHEPIGVVVAVSAFNHPLNLIVHQVAPAIATGCPVIVKPASSTPLSCLSFVKILYEAGLPKEYCQAIITPNSKLATKLVIDERVGFLSFIGSAKVGWMLRSKIAAGTRCALEHGGVAPVIVEADADLDDSLPLLAKAGFYHAGQVCVSVQRVFAHESIAYDLAQDIAKRGTNMQIGDPTLATTEIGPLIQHAETTRIDEWVNEAINLGAEKISGASIISPSCYESTVLYNPPQNAKVSYNEVFAPVICVYPYKNMEDAIKLANSLPFAFQASVFTSNINTAMYAYNNLNASAVMINDHTAFRVDWMPFAGLRHSGLGVCGIPDTMNDMQIEKMMLLRSKNL